MKVFQILGIVDVNMYNTLLDPAVSIEYGDDDLTEEQVDALWDSFNLEAYTAKVCELAVVELRKMLARLPSNLRCTYVEGSARIWSPKYYNYFGDTLEFRVNAETELSEKEFQAYLDDFFRTDWNAEFGPDYRIYENLRENCTIYDFVKEEIA